MAQDAYGWLTKLQDEEAERQSLGAIPYSEAEHKMNPFLHGNETVIAEFTRRDPMTAAFYKTESEPVSLPIFGARRNLTVEGKLFRDPATASVLKVAQVINRQWLDADRASAMEARKAAEKEIERLQSQIA